MANPFDQFDEPASTPQGAPAQAPNPFDQFDDPTSSSARPLTIKADAPSAASDRTWTGTALDLLQSGATGIEKGAVAAVGAPSDIAHLAGQGYAKVLAYGRDKLGLDPVQVPDSSSYDPTKYIGSDALKSGVEKVAGPMYQPQTTAGRYAETVGEFVPSLATGGFGAAAEAAPAVGRTAAGKLVDLIGSATKGTGKAVADAALPGVASEAAGQYTEGTAAEPYARFIGAAAGGGLAAAGRRVITPFTIDPGRQAAIDTLRNEGVTDLTAGQVTGSKVLRNLESQTQEIPFGGSKAADMDEAAKAQFNAAAMRRMGSDADNALPENYAPAKAAIGDAFNDLAARNTLNFDPQMMSDLRGTLDQYRDVLPSERHGQVYDTIADIVDQGRQNGNSLSGQMYQDTRSRLSRNAQAVSQSDPAFANALRGVRDSLDDAMTRSISPDDAAAWQQARRQYGNAKVIEKAATGAGENAAAGNISPAALRSAAVSGRRAGYATGSGDFDDLARAGVQVMSPLPNSGTAGRLTALSLLGGGGFAAGGIPGAVAGAAVPAVASHVLMSPLIQRYLKNQLLPASPKLPQSALLQLMALRGNAVNASRLNSP